jgi:hypothetical protein
MKSLRNRALSETTRRRPNRIFAREQFRGTTAGRPPALYRAKADETESGALALFCSLAVSRLFIYPIKTAKSEFGGVQFEKE